jgi:hypothetical protein
VRAIEKERLVYLSKVAERAKRAAELEPTKSRTTKNRTTITEANEGPVDPGRPTEVREQDPYNQGSVPAPPEQAIIVRFRSRCQSPLLLSYTRTPLGDPFRAPAINQL